MKSNATNLTMETSRVGCDPAQHNFIQLDPPFCPTTPAKVYTDALLVCTKCGLHFKVDY